ncbi:conserved hypothetical protein [Uncinocarpus reesii 1704]|uniref:Ino eighty subunit 1 n=1 Tax=Uncinocarpus reesii (strain UAMH 1704) TaxID=336963 RepID=C4JUF0_UNCRE|nr:uncharacterized protein UREG_04753 [Uncinocarpus reesii 1704]EEP79911.1 conserved hypothetical protein [Uncinocarpus reesii 1704]
MADSHDPASRGRSPSPTPNSHSPSSSRPKPEPSPASRPPRVNGIARADHDETEDTKMATPSRKASVLPAAASPPANPVLPSDVDSSRQKSGRPNAEPAQSAWEKPVKPRRAENVDPSGTRRDTNTRRPSDPQPATESAPASTRKQTNGTIGSVYSGNKIRHLKKDDGIPLWRKDIQYEFLRLVFADKTPCFTRFPEGDKNFTFTDIYLDAMAKSSKTSKILKEKLQTEKSSAINMAMVCLLVNFGRMNTTLNFFPEMRAQLRTYHSIPSLQAHQDSNAYKQLQDAPRLKSILKGASEDVEQPGTVEKVKSLPVPRTNPVNLIFVLSHYAPKISELHFQPPGDFFDLVMRPTLSSKSRARAFLWLMWYYLESDFSEKAALENPFGPGTVGEGSQGLPLKVPGLEELTEQEAEAENVDSPEEIRYGEEKQRERKRILEEDDVIFRHAKRPKKGDNPLHSTDPCVHVRDRSAAGGRRSDVYGSVAATPLNPAKRALEDEDVGEMQTPPQTSRPRSKRPKRDSSANRPPGSQPQRLVLKTRMEQTPDTSSPAPPGAAHPILSQYVSGNSVSGGQSGSRRPRPMTQHQIALELNRKQRVDYALAQRRMETWDALRVRREKEVPFARAGRLLQSLPTSYDTEDEKSWGKGGICPNPEEEEDYGETASFYFSVIRKVARRLQRWDWDSVLSDDKDYPVNGLGANYNRPPVEEHHELEMVSHATSSFHKPKSRSAARRERKMIEDAPEEHEQTKKLSSRGGTGQKKSTATGSKRRSRPSKGTSKPHADAPEQAEMPDDSVLHGDRGAGRGDGPMDTIDQELLGESSLPDTRSRQDDTSSIGLGPEVVQGDGDDTEELSDVDMELSKLGENEYSRGDSLSPDNDVEASQLDDDETVLEV